MIHYSQIKAKKLRSEFLKLSKKYPVTVRYNSLDNTIVTMDMETPMYIMTYTNYGEHETEFYSVYLLNRNSYKSFTIYNR